MKRAALFLALALAAGCASPERPQLDQRDIALDPPVAFGLPPVAFGLNDVAKGKGIIRGFIDERLTQLGITISSSGAFSQLTLASGGSSMTMISQSSYLYTLGEGFASRNAANTGYKPVYGAGFVDYGQSYLTSIKLGLSTGFNTPTIDVPANDRFRIRDAAGTGSATIQFGPSGPMLVGSGTSAVIVNNSSGGYGGVTALNYVAGTGGAANINALNSSALILSYDSPLAFKEGLGYSQPASSAIYGSNITLTDAATTLFVVALPDGARAGGFADVMLEATDGTDHQVTVQTVRWACLNKGGVYTTSIELVDAAGDPDTSIASTGTLSATYDATTGSDIVNFRVTPTGSLTETTYTARVQVRNLSAQTVTMQ